MFVDFLQKMNHNGNIYRTEQKGETMRRDVSIELARLAACLSVIGIHTALSVDLSGSYEYGKIVLGCLVTDAVGVFWLIFGCFLSRRSSYKQLCLNACKKIVLPVALYLAACFYLWDWLTLETPFLAGFSRPPKDYVGFARDIITFQPIQNGGGHLWFVYFYLLLTLLQPFLKASACYLDESPQRQRWFVGLGLGFLLFNDFTNNRFAAFSSFDLGTLIPVCLMALMGHLLYQKREWFSQRRAKSMLLSACLFVSLNLLRALLQLYRYETGGPKNKHIMGWYTAVGAVCACCVVVFCLACLPRKDQSSAVRKGVALLASFTFPVYLIHAAVIAVLKQRQIILKLHCAVYETVTGFAGDLTCNLFTILLVFGISLLIAAVLRLVRQGLRRLMRI